MHPIRFSGAAALFISFCAVHSPAAVITFTGGTVTRLDASTQTTNNTVDWNNVDYYEEDGFRLDFLPNPGSAGFATHVGDYYVAGNDVIHSHWFTGNFGGVAQISITKIGGGTFDLNYFILTSNTQVGDGPATGLELAFIQGLNNNVPTGPAQLLPPEDWGFPATPIVLGSDFDVVDQVTFMVANNVDCFGMDEFYIDEQFPEPASVCTGLIGIGLLGLRRGTRS